MTVKVCFSTSTFARLSLIFRFSYNNGYPIPKFDSWYHIYTSPVLPISKGPSETSGPDGSGISISFRGDHPTFSLSWIVKDEDQNLETSGLVGTPLFHFTLSTIISFRLHE